MTTVYYKSGQLYAVEGEVPEKPKGMTRGDMKGYVNSHDWNDYQDALTALKSIAKLFDLKEDQEVLTMRIRTMLDSVEIPEGFYTVEGEWEKVTQSYVSNSSDPNDRVKKWLDCKSDKRFSGEKYRQVARLVVEKKETDKPKTMIVKIYINENCEPLHNDGTKLTEWEKKQVYAAYANRGLVGDQMEDDEIRWDADKIDIDVFERTFLKPNSHIQVDLPFELIKPTVKKEVEKEESLVGKLKAIMISTYRRFGDDKALLLKGKRSYTGIEVAHEIEIESETGMSIFEGMINLTINLVKRDKIKNP